MLKLDNEKIIEQFKKIHGNKYDYSLVDYKGNLKKVKIICEHHGVFNQAPKNHKRGQGCPRCSNIKNNEDFIEKCKKIHRNKYDYSLTNYERSKTKIKIICPEHGLFLIRPNDHLSGYGCSYCGLIKRNIKITSNNKDFIKKSKKIHNNKYDYSLVEYKNAKTKVEIICPEHGIFEQTPHSHLKGSGCLKCNKISKGEKKILNYLENENIKYEFQKKFNDCKKQNYLPFDFYLLEYNLIIEFDGEQHFKPIKYWGGYESYVKRINNDKYKCQYCENNKIKLIRIRYDENIEKELNEKIRILK